MDTLLALLIFAAVLAVPGRRAGWWPHPVRPEPPLPTEDAATVAALREINRKLGPFRSTPERRAARRARILAADTGPYSYTLRSHWTAR